MHSCYHLGSHAMVGLAELAWVTVELEWVLVELGWVLVELGWVLGHNAWALNLESRFLGF